MNNLTDSVQFDNFDPRTSIGMIARPEDLDAQIQRMLAKIDAFNAPENDFSLQGELKRAEAANAVPRPGSYQEVRGYAFERPIRDAPPAFDASEAALKVSRLERDLQQMSLQLAYLRNQNSAAQGQIEQLRVEKAGIQSVCEQKDALIEQLKRQYAETLQANRDLRQTTQDAVQRACMVREEKVKADAGVDELRERLVQLEYQNSELQAQLQTQSQLEQLIRERVELQKADTQYKELYEVQQQVADLTGVVAEKQAVIADLRAECDGLRKQLQTYAYVQAQLQPYLYAYTQPQPQAYAQAPREKQFYRASVEYTPQYRYPAQNALDLEQLQPDTGFTQQAAQPSPYLVQTAKYAFNVSAADEFPDPSELTIQHISGRGSAGERVQSELENPAVAADVDMDAELQRYMLHYNVTIKPETPQDVVYRRQQEFLEHQRERARSAERARQRLEQEKSAVRVVRYSQAYEPAVQFQNQDRIKQIIANYLLGGEANYLKRITTLDEMAGQAGHLVIILKSVATCGYCAVARIQSGDLVKISGPEQMPARLPFDKIEAFLRWNTAGKRLEILNQKTMSQRVDAVTLNIRKKSASKSQVSQFSYADTL